MEGPAPLLSDISPNGNVQAVVEQDDRVAYLYLMGEVGSDFGVRSCWVRNVGRAPDELDTRTMAEGVSPMLPRRHCRHPQGAPPLEAERVRIVWLEEGDAAALLEDGEILAVVPSWSGQEGFHGYARDCAGQSPLAWELGADSAMHDRVARAAEFWASWEDEPGPWPAVQDGVMGALEAALGPHSNYYAVAGSEWPPVGLVRCPVKDGAALVTVGMCQRPQPTVESHLEDPAPHRRVELGIALGGGDPATERRVAEWIGGQSGLPWAHHLWLGDGHTMPCDAFGAESPMVAVLLREHPAQAPRVVLPSFRGDPVRLLWMVPISADERDMAVHQGSAALAASLDAEGRGWIYRPAAPPAEGWSWKSLLRGR